MMKDLFKAIEINDMDTASHILNSPDFKYEETTLVGLSFFPEVIKLAISNENCPKVPILVLLNSAIISKNSELLSLILEHSYYSIKEDSYFSVNSFILKSLSDNRLACFSVFMEKGYLLDNKTNTADKVLDTLELTSYFGTGGNISDKEHLYLLKNSSITSVQKHLLGFLIYKESDFNEGYYLRINTIVHFFVTHESKFELKEYEQFIISDNHETSPITQKIFLEAIEKRLLFLSLDGNLDNKEEISLQHSKL